MFFVVVVITYWNFFNIRVNKNILNFFFLLFSMQLLENVKLYVQLTPMTHIMLM